MSNGHFNRARSKYLTPKYLYQYEFCLKKCDTVNLQNLALDDTLIFTCMNSCFKKFVDSLRTMPDVPCTIVAQKE